MAHLFALFALGPISPQTLCCEAPLDFISGHWFIALGNFKKPRHVRKVFLKPHLKWCISWTLNHLRCIIQLCIQFTYIVLKKLYLPHLHQVHTLSQFLTIPHEPLNKQLFETNPSQAATTSGFCVFLLIHQSNARSFGKVTAMMTILSTWGLSDIIKIVHFKHKF